MYVFPPSKWGTWAFLSWRCNLLLSGHKINNYENRKQMSLLIVWLGLSLIFQAKYFALFAGPADLDFESWKCAWLSFVISRFARFSERRIRIRMPPIKKNSIYISWEVTVTACWLAVSISIPLPQWLSFWQSPPTILQLSSYTAGRQLIPRFLYPNDWVPGRVHLRYFNWVPTPTLLACRLLVPRFLYPNDWVPGRVHLRYFHYRVLHCWQAVAIPQFLYPQWMSSWQCPPPILQLEFLHCWQAVAIPRFLYPNGWVTGRVYLRSFNRSS